MAEPMRGLSIQEPWLSAIVLSDKRTENRGRRTPAHIIGQVIALHSSQKPDWAAPPRAWAAAGLIPPGPGISGTRWCRDNARILGVIRAVGVIARCHHDTDCSVPAPGRVRVRCTKWAAAGQWHNELNDIQPLPAPVPCGGALGFWPLPDEVQKLVRAQLGGARNG